MFGSTARGASAYAKVGIETGVVSANPHQLIVMLFDGALISLAHAQQYMQTRAIEEKGRSISKAINIMDNGLRTSLNLEAGGEIASSLDALYRYMTGRLMEANLKNDPAMLEDVQRLLSELKSAWEAIKPKPENAAAPVQARLPLLGQSDDFTPISSTLAKA